ncbi:hypothetical protein [Halostella litorea]|uniref:hypothetical protein n=1 Tax=Halostella litorea TaxID=2528831 RepID=UPI001092C096|nr:hypothetical protein [Halostella litorea]
MTEQQTTPAAPDSRPDTPTGKPAGMPTEEYSQQIARLVAVRDAFDAAPQVTSHSMSLGDSGAVSGVVRVLTTGRLAELNGILDEHGLAASAVTLGTERIDGERTQTLGLVLTEA